MIGYAVSYETLKSQGTWVVEFSKGKCLLYMRIFYREHVHITHPFLFSVLSLGSLAEKMEQNVCASAVMTGATLRRQEQEKADREAKQRTIKESKSSRPGCELLPPR